MDMYVWPPISDVPYASPKRTTADFFFVFFVFLSFAVSYFMNATINVTYVFFLIYSYMLAAARQPNMSAKLLPYCILGFALSEALALFTLLIALLELFVFS